MTGETATAKVLRAKGYSSRSQDEASSSPGRQQQQQGGGAGSQAMPRTNTSSARNNVGDEQQLQSFPSFRKPRLDVTVAGRETSSYINEEDGNSASLNANKSGSNIDRQASATPGAGVGTDAENDGSKVAADCLVGDCSTCGDVGFQTELFRCTKCCFRLQHRYCSNSYNPRKRWLIRLCNWCEAEGAAALPSPQPQITGAGASKLISNNQVQQVSSKRDSSSSPWGSGAASRSAERSTHAVECLLGAALRLPGAGFSSVEDLLQVNDSSNVSSSLGSSKRRKPPSFDSVEKARRSGPGGDIRAVKAFKRPATVEKPMATTTAAAAAGPPVKGEFSPPCAPGAGESQRSSSSSVDNGEQQQQRRSSGDHIPTIKVKKSPTSTGVVRSSAAAAAGSMSPTTTTTTSPRGTMASTAAAAAAAVVARDAKTQVVTEPASAARHQRTDVNGGGRNVGPKEDSSTTRAGRASSCDSSERHEQSSTSTTTSTGDAGGAAGGGGGGEAVVVDKAASTSRLSPSNSSRKMRVLSSKSPRSSPRPAAVAISERNRGNERTAAVPEVSSSSLDNVAASRATKRSNAAAVHMAVDQQTQKIRSVPNFKSEAKENNSVGKKSMSVSRPRESSASGVAEAPPPKRPRTVESAEKTTTKSPTASFSKSPSMRSSPRDGDEHSDNSKSSGGGSDCSNVTQEQRRQQQQQQKHNKGGGIAGGKDLSSTSSPEIKSATVKHQPQQMTTGGSQKLARDRPTYSSNTVEKSGTHTSRISNNAEERVQKKTSNHKDTSGKFRRNSSKITGIHNYKSLSDILC